MLKLELICHPCHIGICFVLIAFKSCWSIINWLDARWRLPLFPTSGSLSIPCRSQLFPPPRYLLYPTLNYLLKEHLIFQLTSTRTQTSTMYKLCELHSTQGGALYIGYCLLREWVKYHLRPTHLSVLLMFAFLY